MIKNRSKKKNKTNSDENQFVSLDNNGKSATIID